MSIWGRRVDAMFSRGRAPASREEYDRAGFAAFWQVGLVLLTIALAVAVLSSK